MTDGDGLTYIVLLRSGGFFVFFANAVYAKQVCIQKKKKKKTPPQREKVNKPPPACLSARSLSLDTQEEIPIV